MRIRTVFFSGLVLLFGSLTAMASGPAGICGVIERVVFEPGEESPDRVRVYGAFAAYDATTSRFSRYGEPVAGYLYFSLPEGGHPGDARREWRDLAAVAGTGEAVAFGRFGFIGEIADLPLDATAPPPERNAYFIGNGGGGVVPRVYPLSNDAAVPAEYRSNGVGVTRLGAGNHDELTAALRATLAP